MESEKVLKITRSNVKDKKYVALLNTGRKVNFGYSPMGQFRDSTPLKIFSHKNHGDRKRQIRYLQRHHGGITVGTLQIGDTTANKVEIARSGIVTETKGNLVVQQQINSVASSLWLGRQSGEVRIGFNNDVKVFRESAI